MAIVVPEPVQSRLSLSKLQMVGNKAGTEFLREKGVLLPIEAAVDTKTETLPRGAELDSATMDRRSASAEQAHRAPKTRAEGNMPQRWHSGRGRMREIQGLLARRNPEIAEPLVHTLVSGDLEEVLGYSRDIAPGKGPIPFFVGSFQKDLPFDSSHLRPMIADDEQATKELYEAVRKKVAGTSSGKYPFTIDEMRSVVEEIKPIRDKLRYVVTVGGAPALKTDPVTINRVARAAVMLEALGTIHKASDLSGVGLNRRAFGGHLYAGPAGRRTAALELFSQNLISAATERGVPGHQRATAIHWAQAFGLPMSGFRAGRDVLRSPGTPDLPQMPMTMDQAKAVSRNLRELALWNSAPSVKKALANLSHEELLDRTEQALSTRLGFDRMQEIRAEMRDISKDTGRAWSDQTRALHLMKKARAAMTEDDFLKLGEEISEVPAKPARKMPGVTREARAVVESAINQNLLKKEVRQAARGMNIRPRNLGMAVALAGMLLMGLSMAGHEKEAA
jgi:hypothetical protein